MWPKTDVLTTRIYELLYALGIRAELGGFFYTAYAVRLAVEQPHRLLLMERWVYPEIARRYHASPQRVERDIHMVIHTVWKEHPRLLITLAGHPIQARPTVAAFLFALGACLSEDFAA